MLQGQKFILY